jgi:hypothetical protein
MSCTTCGAPLDATSRFCQRCGAPVDLDAAATSAAPPSPLLQHSPIVEDDPWLGHLLRMIGVYAAQTAALYACLAGLVWEAHMFSRTGYRKRDMLWLFVPVWNVVVTTRCLWRYTARDVYWSPRDDRPSDVLRGWQRPASIALGWAALPIAAVIGIVIALTTDGWTDQQRRAEVQSLVEAGFTRADAECVVAEVEEQEPHYLRATDLELERAVDLAMQRCEVRR